MSDRQIASNHLPVGNQGELALAKIAEKSLAEERIKVKVLTDALHGRAA